MSQDKGQDRPENMEYSIRDDFSETDIKADGNALFDDDMIINSADSNIKMVRKGLQLDPVVVEILSRTVGYPFQRWVNLMMTEQIKRDNPEYLKEIIQRAKVFELPYPENIYYQVLKDEYITPPANWAQDLNNAFSYLTSDEVWVLELKFRDRLTLDVIAKRRNIAKETVRVIMKRAIKILQTNKKTLLTRAS